MTDKKTKTSLEKIGTIAGIWGAILSTALAVFMYCDRIEQLDCKILIPLRPKERDAAIYNLGRGPIWLQEVQLRFYHSNSYSIFYLLSARNGPVSVEPGSMRAFSFDTNEIDLMANALMRGPSIQLQKSSDIKEKQSIYVITGRSKTNEWEVSLN